MRTIAIINLKGGTAKTTTTVNLAAELRHRGKRVLCIDADPQHNLTDFLGASTDGTTITDLLAGNLDTPNARIHNAPVAQTAEGLWLGERTEVHAMTDLSDGLASDLRHIAEQSHVGATVDLERIPIAPDSDLVTALTGGEDYKLLFTAAPEALPALCRAFESRFGRPLYPIGTVTEAEDDTIVWLDRGRRVETDWRGYEHNA